MCPIGAHPCVGVAEFVVPGCEPPQEVTARSDDLAAPLDDLAIQLEMHPVQAGRSAARHA